MTGASIEVTLELWASSLRKVSGRMRWLFTQEQVAASANLFLDGLLGNERRKTGWVRERRPAILVRGGNRLFWAVGAGTWTGCAISCEIILSKTSPQTMRSCSSMRPASSSRARHPAASRVNISFGWQDNELPDRCVRRLCIHLRPCLNRSGCVIAQELDRRSRVACRGPCA